MWYNAITERKWLYLNKNYKPKEFAELLNVSILTLQRWDNAGKLKAFRTPTNRRYYTYQQYKEFKGITSSNHLKKEQLYIQEFQLLIKNMI